LHTREVKRVAEVMHPISVNSENQRREMCIKEIITLNVRSRRNANELHRNPILPLCFFHR
jgi:hypothetical protein